MKKLPIGILLLALLPVPCRAAPVKVVATLPAYASIAQFVGGDRVEAAAISRGDEDAHFVKPKPSFALMLKTADLFITTGLDLELWAPTLVDKSGNRQIRDGATGFVSASQRIPMLDVPDAVSRAQGDIHIYGNPHIHTSPLNAKLIAANIVAGLERVDPAGAAAYRANLTAFERRIDVALFGENLVELLGSETLDRLARQGALVSFLRGRKHEGRPLIDRLGGWLGRGLVFRDREIVAYHQNWSYFADLFGVRIADYIERKPGIPPSARHVHDLLELIESRKIPVLLAASYFSRSQVEKIAERAGCVPVIVHLGPMEVSAEGYFDLVDSWVEGLATAFTAGRAGP